MRKKKSVLKKNICSEIILKFISLKLGELGEITEFDVMRHCAWEKHGRFMVKAWEKIDSVIYLQILLSW